MKKVAVTGATGHIGANLVRELINRGYEVVTLVRETSRALEGLDVTRIQGDLLDQQSLCNVFRGVEHVYHLAAYISIEPGQKETLDRVNIEGTANVIAACQSEGVSTLVYFSSIHALDQDSPGQEVNEKNKLVSDIQGDGGDYDYSKAMAERLVRNCSGSALSTRVIYPTAVIGPNDFRLSLFGTAILKMAQGRLPALVKGGYNWVDARDVACGAVEAAEAADGDHRYILSGHFMALSEVAEVIAGLTGVAAPAFNCPLWLARLTTPLVGLWARLRGQAPLYTRYSLSVLSENKMISHDLATQKLGYQPRPFHISMKDALHSYAEHGHLELKQDTNG
jgi:dihydroflavonol-4-reductase